MRLTQWTDYTLRVLMDCAASDGRAQPVTRNAASLPLQGEVKSAGPRSGPHESQHKITWAATIVLPCQSRLSVSNFA